MNLLVRVSQIIKADPFQAAGDMFGSNLTPEQTEMVTIDYLRHALSVSLHFKIDALFSSVLQHLDCIPRRRGFWNSCKAILRCAGLPVDGRERDLLVALAYVRNSFHNNGIHRGSPLELEIQRLAFEFLPDQRVECASFTHIVALTAANVTVVERILLSGRVGGIKGEIPDTFTNQAH